MAQALPRGRAPRKRRRKRRFYQRPRFLLSAALALALLAGGTWLAQRPASRLLSAPELTASRKLAILQALFPGWPQARPTLATPDGAKPVAEVTIERLAAADVDRDGRPDWGVSYCLTSLPDALGDRCVQPGFAVLAGGDRPEVLFRAPGFGGWDGPNAALFDGVDSALATVEPVDLGVDGVGFLQRVALDAASGGRQVFARTRLYAPVGTAWGLAWEGPAEELEPLEGGGERSRSLAIRVRDVDGDGRAELLASESWTFSGHAPLTVRAPGEWAYARRGERYELAWLVTGETRHPVRRGAPLWAVRAPKPPVIDGRFGDWDAWSAGRIGDFAFEALPLLRSKLRERRGLEDFSAQTRLMWDEEALYVRARVTDDRVLAGPGGAELLQGDHLALWLDTDLASDFAEAARSDDDWQLGFAPGAGGPARSTVWLPRASSGEGLRVASQPLLDPYNGARRGYTLEAAIPWRSVGGAPPGFAPAAKGAKRGASWRLAGVLGCALTLTDADERPAELQYASAERFSWAVPTTFNTLLLVEP